MNILYLREHATVSEITRGSSAKFGRNQGQRSSEKSISLHRGYLDKNGRKRIVNERKSSGVGVSHDHNVADIQAASVADPIPTDNGLATTPHRTTLTVAPTFSLSPEMILTKSSIERSTETSLEMVTSDKRTTTTVWIYPSTFSTQEQSSTLQGYIAKTSGTSKPISTNSPHIPVFVFVLIGIGGLCISIAALLIFRSVLRRHDQQDRPRPSAPILQDSPLFGGKERLSRGIWSDPSFGNLLASHTKNGNGNWKNDGWRPLSGGKETGGGENYGPGPVREDKEPQMQELNKRQSTFLSPNVATSKDPDRLPPSPVSPSSVYTQAIPVGVALDYDFPIPPMSTMPLNVKNKKEVRKKRHSAQVVISKYPISSPTFTETDTTIAYQDPRPAPTPGGTSKPKPGLKASNSGSRSNPHKNVYTHKSKPSIQRSISTSRKERDELIPHAIPSTKSKAHRDRDTKALTSALGLTSPSSTPQPPPSSCFSPVSIYPDDSLSVAHGRGRKFLDDEPHSEMPSPAGTHAALGDLMLQEFPSSATFASMRVSDPFADVVGYTSSQTGIKKSGSGSLRRAGDRPPRVPSPPPLPSLSQMALANADADYRSPTYSIYGLYEAQRKSRNSMISR